ncbi:hypothetical protein B1A_02891, partial [mine drainage metagenome]
MWMRPSAAATSSCCTKEKFWHREIRCNSPRHCRAMPSFWRTSPRRCGNLQAQIAQLPGVVDTVIQGDGLRIVMQQAVPPALPENLAGYGTPKAVPTRLEDAFVSPFVSRTARHPIPLPPQRDTTGDHAAVVVVKDLFRYFGAFAA